MEEDVGFETWHRDEISLANLNERCGIDLSLLFPRALGNLAPRQADGLALGKVDAR